MNSRLFLRYFSYALFVYCIIGYGVFLSVADIALGKNGFTPLPPTVLALVFLSPLAGIVLCKDFFLSSSRNSAILSMLQANGRVLAAFLLVVFISLAWSMHPTAYWYEGGKWIFLPTYSFAIFLAASLAQFIDIIRRNFRVLIVCGLIPIVLSMWYELFFAPGLFSTVISRAAGFAGNSNFGALVVVLLCAAALNYNTKSIVSDLTILLISGLGVFSTMSRSGLINYGLILVFYTKFVFFSRGADIRKAVIFLISGFVFIGFFGLIIPFVAENAEVFKSHKTRFANFEGSSQIDDGSADSRIRAAEEAVNLIEDGPILGHGTGYTRNMDPPPHNIYLQQWVNNGVPGLLAWVFLLFIGFRTFQKRSYYKGMTFIACATLGGLFSHNVLDQRPLSIIFGSFLTLSWMAQRKEQEEEPQIVYIRVPNESAPIE